MCKSLSIPKTNPVTAAYDHEKYLRISIQQTRWILKSIGLWPRSLKSSLIVKYAYVMLNVICIGLISFLFIPCVLYVVFEVEDTYTILKFFGPLCNILIVYTKYSSIIFHRRNIRLCLEYIKSDCKNTLYYGDRAIMIRNAEFTRRLVLISASFTYGGVLFYHLAMPIGVGKVTEDDNITYLPLVYPVAKVIIDTRYSPICEIFFWIQCVAGFFLQSVTAAACSLTAVLAMHACGRAEILMQWILHLVEGREDFHNNINKRLALIVEEHVRILRFISLVEKVLREISLVEIIGSTLIICLVGYYIIMEWQIGLVTSYVTYIILLVNFTFNIFIFCYIGELVAEQSKRIREISYMINWYRLPGKKALAVMLMMAMSNSSIKLTAGNIIDLSICSFGDVIKTSVAYLNILRTLTS